MICRLLKMRKTWHEEQETGLSPDKIKKAMEELPKGSRMIFSLYFLKVMITRKSPKS